MTNIPIQSLPVSEDKSTFADEQQILEDWQRFITGGFRQGCYTERLHDFLCQGCAFIARRNRLTFWATFFNAEAIFLQMFLNQFGGNGRSVDYNTHAWLDGPAADLKQAMCREATRLYAPLLQVLEDLEQKHVELGRVWQEFAIANGVPDPGFPPYYLISENTRNLLAYAARIALDQPQIIRKAIR